MNDGAMQPFALTLDKFLDHAAKWYPHAEVVTARAGARQQTDVLALNADLLEVVTEGDKHWASIRFSGSLRESPGEAPQGFEEVWNLSKPVSGGGWQLAGIQQMH